MFLHRILLTAVISGFAFSASAQSKNYEVAAVAFYNFENLFDTEDDPNNWGDDEFLPTGPYRYDETVYQQKLTNLATVISQLGSELTPDGPAILGTTEVENARVLTDLARHPLIAHRNYQVIHFDSRDSRGIDVGLLYNPVYFKVLSARPLLVDISGQDGKGGRTRDVLFVHGILAGDTISVLVNHWPSRRGGESASAPLRAIAAAVNRVTIDSLMRHAPSKVIIMGDFNDDPTDPSITKVLGASGDRKNLKTGGVYNPFVSFYKKGIGTSAYNDSWGLFDQIMLTEPLVNSEETRWKYYKAEVFNKEFLKNKFGRWKGYPLRSFDNNNWQNGYSDHFPAVVYLVRAAQR